jgi:hypothetical protein
MNPQKPPPPPTEVAAVEGAPETCEPMPVPPLPTTTTTTATTTTQKPPFDPSSCCFPHVDASASRVKGDDGLAGTTGRGYGSGE